MEETSRLPEGVEWPRYESGDLVMFGDCVENRNGTCTVNSVRFYSGGGVTVYGEDRGSRLVVVTEPVMHEPIRKARPKVLAADGEPLEVGQTVWHVDTGDEFYVSCFSCWTVNVSDKKGGGLQLLPSQLTHQRPVLDADGVPIREGDTVWSVNDGTEYKVGGIRDTAYVDGVVCKIIECSNDEFHIYYVCIPPDQLTHQRPVLAADGVPIKKGDTVWHKATGIKYRVFRFSAMKNRVWGENDFGSFLLDCSMLAHTKPELSDTWERIEEDARGLDSGVDRELFTHTHEDLVRRCRALAERERGE